MIGAIGALRRAVLAIVLVWPGTGFASGTAEEFIDMVASLQRLQDQVAQGVPGTREAQADLVRYIDSELKTLTAQLPYSTMARDAALAYLLIGGNARGLFSIRLPLVEVAEGEEAEDLAEDPLLTLARYVLKSRGQLDPSVLEGLDVRLAGRILEAPLALEQVEAFSETKEVIERLRRARVAGTGTLVEEVALRKLATIYLDAKRYDEYLSVVSRYMRAFGRSPYASRTFSSFARFAASSDGDKRRYEVKRLLAFLPDDLKGTMRRSIQRQAVLRGNLELVAYFDVDKPTSAQDRDSSLVDAITAFEERGEKETMNILRNIDASTLADADRDLLRAAKRVFSEFGAFDDLPPAAPEGSSVAQTANPTTAADRDETMIDDSQFSSIDSDLERLSERVRALGIEDAAIGESR